MYHMYNSLSHKKRKISGIEDSSQPGTLSSSQLASTIRTESSNDGEVYFSQPIHDRKSKFLAAFSSSPSYLASPTTLQAHPALEGAMHRILGVRKRSSQQTLLASSLPRFFTDSDEDGEKWAGKRVEAVLAELGIEGVVVVGRWYGGVMLGPVRFVHIENVVKGAVAAWAEGSLGNHLSDSGNKKVKVDEVVERQEKEKLIGTLEERDRSVDVLRGLLEDKKLVLAKMETKDDSGGQGPSPVASPAKKIPDYQAMDIARLKSQEKARDATLAWILKQIDVIEKKIEAVEFEAFAKEVEANEVGIDEDDSVSKPESSIKASDEKKIEAMEQDSIKEIQPPSTRDETCDV